ncbi:MAG: hypothetical protein K2Q25_02630 [Mycobacteriaceae bacterium]|nr:hypothetical protein [Mycobacteriaceae bacterium]
MAALSKFAGQVDFTFVITRITAAANCFAQQDLMGGMAQLSAGIGLFLTINYDKFPGYDNSVLPDFFDPNSVNGSNGPERQHLLPTPTVILDVTMWLIAALDLFNGYGVPDNGVKFRCGSAELDSVHFALESAAPDSRDWDGEKAAQYADQNASLGEFVRQLQGLDLQVQQQVAGQSQMVIQVHRAVSLLIAGLVAARGVALGIYFCSPIPQAAKVGKGSPPVDDFDAVDERETAPFLDATQTQPVGYGPAAALAFQAVVAAAALGCVAYFENATRANSENVSDELEKLGDQYASIAAQVDQIGNFAHIVRQGTPEAEVVNLRPMIDVILGSPGLPNVDAVAAHRALPAPATTPTLVSVLGREAGREGVPPSRQVPGGRTPAERADRRRPVAAPDTEGAQAGREADGSGSVPREVGVDWPEASQESWVLDRTA